MNEVANFLQSVSGPKYNLGLLNSSPTVSAPVGLNGYEQKPTQTAQASTTPAQSGSAYPGSLLGDPTAVNDAVSQGIGTFGGNRASSWDGTSGTIGIGQGATTDANQAHYINKGLMDFATGMNYTPFGAFKAVAKNGLAYNMNNRDILGLVNDPKPSVFSQSLIPITFPLNSIGLQLRLLLDCSFGETHLQFSGQ